VQGIVEMASPRNFFLPAGATLVSGEASLSTDFDRLWYSAPSFVFSGGRLDAAVSLSGTESRIDLGESRIDVAGEVLVVSGNARFGSPGTADFSLNADYMGLPYFIEGNTAPGSVRVRGSNGLDISLTGTAGRNYRGYARSESFPLPFLGQPALLSVAADLNFADTGNWSVDLGQMEIADMAGPAGLTRVMLSGQMNQRGGTFPVMLYEDAVGLLSGQGEFSVEDSGFAANIFAGDGTETYAVQAAVADGVADVSVSASASRLYRFSNILRNTSADRNLRIVLRPSGEDPLSAWLDLSSVSGRIGSSDFRASANATLEGGELSVNGLQLNAGGFYGSASSFVLSRESGSLGGSLRFGGVLGGRPVSGEALLDVAFDPVRSWQYISGAADSFSGRLSVTDFAYGDLSQTESFDFVFARYGRTASVSGGPEDMLRLRLDNEGNFFAALSNPFPLRGTLIGSFSDGEINARGNDLFLDLDAFFRAMPVNEDFFISDGFVSFSVDIRGPVGDPEFHGTARVSGARIHIPGFITQEMRPVPFNAVIDGGEIRFGPVPVAVGAGAGTASAVFGFERWVPRDFSIDVNVPRATPIPFAMDISGFTANGNAAGGIVISMENRMMNYSGDLWINNSELGVDIELLPDLDLFNIMMGRGGDRRAAARGRDGEDPFSDTGTPFALDMRISTGPSVEFLYPLRMPLIRATPEIGSFVNVSVDSIARQYSITGDVNLRRGEVFYFQRSFYLRQGMIVFWENEESFDPRITARAEIRERNSDGPVTVSIVADNQPISSFSPRFESSPPLSQMEISGLLGQNLVGSAGDGQDDSISNAALMQNVLASTTDIIAQFSAVRAIEQRIRNFTRLDMFSIRTQVLQNAILLGTGFMRTESSGTPGSDVDTTPRLGNYFDNTTIFAGKYIGQDVFVQGMVSMRHDPARSAFGGLVLQPDIGLDIQGPEVGGYRFRIRWDFVPTSTENMFVNDNSITLTFSRMF
jgi:hypothetical protein